VLLLLLLLSSSLFNRGPELNENAVMRCTVFMTKTDVFKRTKATVDEKIRSRHEAESRNGLLTTLPMFKTIFFLCWPKTAAGFRLVKDREILSTRCFGFVWTPVGMYDFDANERNVFERLSTTLSCTFNVVFVRPFQYVKQTKQFESILSYVYSVVCIDEYNANIIVQ